MELVKFKFMFILFILLEVLKFMLEFKVFFGNLIVGFLVIMIWNVFGILKLEMRWKSFLEGYVILVNFCFLLSERNFIIKILEEKDVGIWMIEVINSLKIMKV